jgi:hypothetical protein
MSVHLNLCVIVCATKTKSHDNKATSCIQKSKNKKKRLKEITKSVKHVMVCICCQETIKMDEGGFKIKKKGG